MQVPNLIYFFSENFLIFFSLFFLLYWTVRGKSRIWVLLIGSYSFYASWDWRFLFLLILSTFIDYFCSLKIDENKRRKFYLRLSILSNVLLLCIFKYFDFFVDSFKIFSNTLGLGFSDITLSIALPVGLSFYTFQSLGYTLDVYFEKTKAQKNFLEFASFVGFFPQLIAGPIERASNLIPQIKAQKSFKSIEFEKGIYLFIFGLFKKVVIADHLMLYITSNDELNSSLSLIILLCYVFHVYCDISGYTNMARGIAYLLGIKLSANFNFPFFATNPMDFWQRWHITLSNWIKDYVYMPSLIQWKKPLLSLLVAFFVMGVWHGNKDTFWLWFLGWPLVIGVYYFIKSKMTFQFHIVVSISMMFVIMFIMQSYDRVGDFLQYKAYLTSILSFDFQSIISASKVLILIILFFAYECVLVVRGKEDEFYLLKRNFYIKSTFYIALFFMYRNYEGIAKANFIYFNN